MKKQLLIAAVAASMTSVAMADVSISGVYAGTLSQSTGTASFAQDLDLKIVGKSGDTTVTATIENIGVGTGADQYAMNATTVKLSTKLEGISFSAGNYKSFSGNGLVNKPAAAERIGFSTSVAGVGVAMTNKSGHGAPSITLTGDVAGFGVKVQNATNSARYISLKGNVAGLALDIENSGADDNVAAVKVSGTIGGMSVSYANLDCGTVKVRTVGSAAASACTETRGSAPYGNISTTAKVKGLIVSTATTMGKVTFKNIDKDGTDTNVLALQRGNVSYKYAKTDLLDATLSAKVKFKF
jgi:hypothetical protein